MKVDKSSGSYPFVSISATVMLSLIMASIVMVISFYPLELYDQN